MAGSVESTTGTLTISNVQPADAGSYTLVVTNGAGAATSAVATLTVNGPPVITTPPASQTVVAGTNVNFSVTASGTQPLSYQWRFNGGNLADGGQISGSGGATLTVSNVQPANAGGYSVVVTNVAGSATSAVATLSVTVPGNCVSAPAGIVGWWPGDGNANDIVGTNNGTLQGGATATAIGFDGMAFSFDGTNGSVRIPDSPALKPTNLTVEAWVRFSGLDSAGNSTAGQQYIIFKQNTKSSNFEGYSLNKARGGSGDYFAFVISSSVRSGSKGQFGAWDSNECVVSRGWGARDQLRSALCERPTGGPGQHYFCAGLRHHAAVPGHLRSILLGSQAERLAGRGLALQPGVVRRAKLQRSTGPERLASAKGPRPPPCWRRPSSI